jgi:hypothetical protein
MKLAVAFGFCFLVFAASSHAQENLVGKYSGHFMLPTQTRGIIPIGLSLEITSAADGKVEGKANRYADSRAGRGCEGEYKVAGTYEGNKIEMKSEPGGPAKDCIMRLQLVAEGRKLKGKMGTFDVELSK